MKRLTKSQYESIADSIAHIRKINLEFEFVDEESKKQREIMADQIITALANGFSLEDDRFSYNQFWHQCQPEAK